MSILQAKLSPMHDQLGLQMVICNIHWMANMSILQAKLSPMQDQLGLQIIVCNIDWMVKY